MTLFDQNISALPLGRTLDPGRLHWSLAGKPVDLEWSSFDATAPGGYGDLRDVQVFPRRGRRVKCWQGDRITATRPNGKILYQGKLSAPPKYIDDVALVEFLRSQICEEGGFREIRASKRAGTNPTAAAIGSLRILGALDENTRLDTIDFLAEMQMDDGGLRANTRIPIADLLSTFTGLLTLQDLGGTAEIDTSAVRRFVESLELEEGGFRGAEWDPAHDVEYTFYGLGTLGLLTHHA
jgi:hypothetical protein